MRHSCGKNQPKLEIYTLTTHSYASKRSWMIGQPDQNCKTNTSSVWHPERTPGTILCKPRDKPRSDLSTLTEGLWRNSHQSIWWRPLPASKKTNIHAAAAHANLCCMYVLTLNQISHYQHEMTSQLRNMNYRSPPRQSPIKLSHPCKIL